jgi:putative aldouronate transport system substrate-binding protein
MYLYNEYKNIPTPSMVDKGSTLDKMENETFIKIIMGASIDEFDKFIENWKKLGGDEITKELNEAK